jgi:hypothetical protein
VAFLSALVGFMAGDATAERRWTERWKYQTGCLPGEIVSCHRWFAKEKP